MAACITASAQKSSAKLCTLSCTSDCRDSREQPPSEFVLLLASLCLKLRDRTVPHMTSLLESAFMSHPSSPSGMWFDAALLTRRGLRPAMS
jgi:hypothetical protein